MIFTNSLKKNNQFRMIYKSGHSVANRQLVMYYRKNNTNENRLGISVSKKIGKAVVRNHTKRLIKEGYLALEPQIPRGYDFIFIARIPAATTSYHELKKSIMHLLNKQGLASKESDGAVL